MPKRNRKTKKQPKKLHLADNEKLLVELEEIAKKGQVDASPANSLKMWYIENGYWTQKQLSYARALVRRFKDKGVRKAKTERKYQLYAITDGFSVKLGYSSDIKRRIKQMQTGHPEKLKCIWKFYTGKNEEQAKRLEKKLHRFCKKYSKRGEWFEMGCMELVEKFSVREKTNRDFNIERQEMEIVAAAMNRI